MVRNKNMTNAQQVDERCQRAGVILVAASGDAKIRALSEVRIQRALRTLIQENKAALLHFLNESPTADELEAVRRSGRNPSPLLTHGEARELAMLPPPPKATKWQSLTSDYFPVRSDDPRWFRLPATVGQISFLRRTGLDAPADAKRGECSYAINAIKGRSP